MCGGTDGLLSQGAVARPSLSLHRRLHLHGRCSSVLGCGHGSLYIQIDSFLLAISLEEREVRQMGKDSSMGACSVPEVLTSHELYGKAPVIGIEWDLCTITHGDNPGRYTARLALEGWKLIFQPFTRDAYHAVEQTVAIYGHGEEAERAVKSLGLRICEQRREEAKCSK